MVIDSLLEAIGNTPVLRIPLRRGEVELFLKLEMFNPTGSMKDRMATNMINKLGPFCPMQGEVSVVESSSGNTASALSMICAIRNLKFTALMDRHASQDKILTVSALGGAVKIVGNGDDSLATEVRDAEAKRMCGEDDRINWTEQHNNDANSEGYFGLAHELYTDLDGSISHYISAIGTGGSLCGTGQRLRQLIPDIKIIGVEPIGSIIFGGEGHAYLQSGTGTPKGANVGLVIDYDVIDEGRKVGDAEAFSVCHYMAKTHGLLIGGSTGGALFEAFNEAQTAPSGSRIVTLACDSGTKYLDTIFCHDWLAERGTELMNIPARFSNLMIGGTQGDVCATDCSGRSTRHSLQISKAIRDQPGNEKPQTKIPVQPLIRN